MIKTISQLPWRINANNSPHGLRAAPFDVSRLEEGRSGDHWRNRSDLQHFQKTPDESGSSAWHRGLCRKCPRSRWRLAARKAEPDMAFVHCLKSDYTSCALLPACVMRQALKLAGNAFLEVLDGYTL